MFSFFFYEEKPGKGGYNLRQSLINCMDLGTPMTPGNPLTFPHVPINLWETPNIK